MAQLDSSPRSEQTGVRPTFTEIRLSQSEVDPRHILGLLTHELEVLGHVAIISADHNRNMPALRHNADTVQAHGEALIELSRLLVDQFGLDVTKAET